MNEGKDAPDAPVLEVKCPEHLEKVRAFAQTVPGGEEALNNALERLRVTCGPGCRVELYDDFAPWSFRFAIFRASGGMRDQLVINGGLLYSGPGGAPLDGSFPALSVDLGALFDPEHGKQPKWKINT